MKPARRSRRLVQSLLIAGAVLAPVWQPSPAAAQEAVPTRLVVRVVASDAKIIGSGVGGVHVVVRDQRTGEVLAQGMQEGGTGNTDLIMNPQERGATVFDTDGAAGFRAEIPLTGPTPVTIEYRGPMGTPHAVQQGSTSVLMLPGEHMDGEGVVVVLHGFTVELLSPEAQPFEAAAGEDVGVRARVTMLCGCPTEPGGLWDASGYDIRAQWIRDGEVVEETALAYSGTRSEYTGTLRAPADAGPVTLRVISVDRARANTGMVEALGRIR